MRHYLTIVALLAYSLLPAQNTQLAGLQFYNSQLRPSIINSIDASCTEIRPTPTSADHFISGNSTIDRINNFYYYVRGGRYLYKVDYNTGVSSVASIDNPLDAVAPATCIQYDAQVDSIYALALKNHNLYFVRISPSSGDVDLVIPQAISGDGYGAGDATFDQVNRIFYFVRSSQSGSHTLIAVDIANKSISTTPIASTATHPLINIQWSYSQQCLFGLELKNSALKLAKFIPSTNQYTVLSSSPLSSSGIESGVAALDDDNNRFYYLRGTSNVRRLMEVNTNTGALLSNQSINSFDNKNLVVNIEVINSNIPVSRFFVREHCTNHQVRFDNASIGQSFTWSFGDGNSSTSTNPIHNYANPGYYNTYLVASANGTSDTAFQNITVNPPVPFSLGNDTFLLAFDTITISAPAGSSNPIWSTGETSQAIHITQPGIYWCEATISGCTLRDSLEVFPVAALSIDTSEINRWMDFPGLAYATISFYNNTARRDSLTVTPSQNQHMHDMQVSSNALMHDNHFIIEPYKVAKLHVIFDLHQDLPNQYQHVEFKHDSIGIFDVRFTAQMDPSTGLTYITQSNRNIINPVGIGQRVILNMDHSVNFRVYSLNGQLINSGCDTEFVAPSMPGVYLIYSDDFRHKLIVQ